VYNELQKFIAAALRLLKAFASRVSGRDERNNRLFFFVAIGGQLQRFAGADGTMTIADAN
jgi:hypothetical protein